MHRVASAFLWVVVALGVVDDAHAQAPPSRDPVCAIDIDGVSALSSVADAKAAWGRLGLAATEEVGSRAPGYPVLTQLRFGADPGNASAADQGPLRLAYSSQEGGRVSVSRAEADTVRVVRKTGERPEVWRQWSFADRVAARVAQFCNGNDPRVSCTFEGTQPRYIRITPPVDGTLPYCTYTLSLQGRGGKVYRAVAGETEADAVGDLQESLSLERQPPKDQVRGQRGGARGAR
jgi:hypothetical protein